MLSKKILTLLVCLSSLIATSQITITGTVFDEYLEPFPGATITSPTGNVTTDYDGIFTLQLKQFPTTIKVTSIGYSTETIQISDANADLNIILKETYALDQVVISASRTPERIMESPVSIERTDTKDIKRSSSLNFYENLANLKGIDVLSNSFNIKNVVSNRGFANTENTRFVQIVDGTESTLPFINYSLGNTFGLSELDVKNIEVLPGAASALYGPNALNGILLMTSKNPFDSSGISTYIKTGVTSQDDRATMGFNDIGIRMAYAFSNKIAAKANFTYSTGEEWHATDYRNTTEQGGVIIDGDRNSDQGYDGLNVYGDEINANLIDLAITGEDLGSVPEGFVQNLFNFIGSESGVSRTGYNEIDLIDYRTRSLSFDGSIFYRPWGDDNFEVILNSKYNISDNIIHGSNRYSQKDGLTQQHRLEFKGKDFFLRGYYTQNNANLVDPRLVAFYVNENTKSPLQYFSEYLTVLQQSGWDPASARAFADQNRPDPNSSEFQQLVNQAKNISVNEGGASLQDRSGFFHLDGNYNLSQLIDFAEIQVGGSYRRFILNSDGQIYTDLEENITYDEFGAYAQLQKKLAEDRMKLTLTGRYDKSKNFAGNFSPRASVTYAAGEKRDHNFRVSYQTGFRNPTTQDQYASINLGDRTILGSVEDNLRRESSQFDVRSATGIENVGSNSATLTGIDNVKNNSYTLSSVEEFRLKTRNDIATGTPGEASRNAAILANASILEKAEFDFVKSETVQTLELGYRGATKLSDNLFEFDVAAYYNVYNNFITQKAYWSPFYGDVDSGENDGLAPTAVLLSDVRRYIIRTNTDAVVNSYGLTAGFVTKVFSGFNLGANYAYANFEDDGTDPEFKTAYNTPKHKIKVQFGHDKLFKNFGFNINARWQDAFLYQSVFIDDQVNARTVLDAQVNYTIPSFKSTFKIGGTNIAGDNYTSVPGTGTIGSVYYISWTLNN